MADDDRLGEPAAAKVVVSVLVGLALGALFAFPALQRWLGIVAVEEGSGIARVLIVGLLAIAGVTFGLVGLYQFYVLGR